MAWRVVMQPQGKNPGILKKAAGETGVMSQEQAENVGGVIVYVQDGDNRKEEVARVGYIRRASKNPGTSFKDQLAQVRATAQEAVDELNNIFAQAGELQ